ncbi:uncharacterized protein HaLaN_30636, partial [Haematococcus lacustris]
YEEYFASKPPLMQTAPIPLEGSSTVYDYCFDKAKLRWQLWTDTLPALAIPPGSLFSDLIIPTKDSARLGGDKLEGLGLGGMARRGLGVGQLEDREEIDGRLDKRKKGVYGPPPGRKAVVFVDDLNMPAKETYGAQPPIELLRQFMDYKGWYGRDNLMRAMVDTQFVAAMGPPGGGRTFVTNRYLRHFNLLALAQVSDDTLAHIFRTILDWHLTSLPFSPAVRQAAPAIIQATLFLYSQSIAKLLPTPTKSHYVFNLRDFARVVQGCMMLPPSSLPVDGSAAVLMFKRLWVHEVARVFQDRLVDDQDREWLMGQ